MRRRYRLVKKETCTFEITEPGEYVVEKDLVVRKVLRVC